MRAATQGGVVAAAMQPHESAWLAEAVQARLDLAGSDDLGETERAFLVRAVDQLGTLAASLDPRLLQSMRQGRVLRRPA